MELIVLATFCVPLDIGGNNKCSPHPLASCSQGVQVTKPKRLATTSKSHEQICDFSEKRLRKRKTKNLVIILLNCLNSSCTFQLHCTLCQSYPELLLDSVYGAILFLAVRCTPHGLHRLRTYCRSPVSITCAALTRSRASRKFRHDGLHGVV